MMSGDVLASPQCDRWPQWDPPWKDVVPGVGGILR